MLKAAIFDMDGLLIDSEPFWRSSHMEVLADQGVVIVEDDVRAMAGRRTDEVVHHWRERHNLLHIPNRVLENAVTAKVIAHINEEGEALAGAEALMAQLQTRRIPVAIASSSAPDIIDTVVRKLDFDRYVQLAHSAKHEAFGKPHPAVFLSTANMLEVPPAHCVVFEDAASGVQAAKAAGMKCVAVPEAANAHKPEFHEADLVLESLEQVTIPMLRELWR